VAIQIIDRFAGAFFINSSFCWSDKKESYLYLEKIKIQFKIKIKHKKACLCDIFLNIFVPIKITL
jgi:hypothetical protein